MPKEVPLCEGDITNDRFIEVKNFLKANSLTSREALVVYEVVYSGDRYYCGADLIARKLSAYGFNQKEVEEIIKNLFQPSKGHLKPYTSKKEVLCCQPEDYGIDAARVMRNNCYTTILPEYERLEQESLEKAERTYSNPASWYLPREVGSWDSNGEKMSIHIRKLEASDEISHTTDGEAVWRTIVHLEIVCKVCRNSFETSLEFSDDTFWGFDFQAKCPVCHRTYTIMKDLRSYSII